MKKNLITINLNQTISRFELEEIKKEKNKWIVFSSICVLMGIVFFIVITPIGLIMRLIGKDLLNKKIDKSLTSYWNKREQMIGTMKNQF